MRVTASASARYYLEHVGPGAHDAVIAIASPDLGAMCLIAPSPDSRSFQVSSLAAGIRPRRKEDSSRIVSSRTTTLATL